jgi:hypothetical protein
VKPGHFLLIGAISRDKYVWGVYRLNSVGVGFGVAQPIRNRFHLKYKTISKRTVSNKIPIAVRSIIRAE